MKIAYVNASLRVGQDGVSRVVHTMISGARARGHEVAGITASEPLGAVDYPICRVPSMAFPLQKNYRIAFPGYLQFRSFLDTFQPDMLHLNSPCTLGFSAVKYAEAYGVPVVATYHTHFPSYPQYYKLKRFEHVAWRISRHFYNGVDRTFIPTMPILHELEAHGLDRLEYLPNGVDTTAFNPAWRSHAWRRQFGERDVPIVLFVSRLMWEKNLSVLVETYKRLRATHGDGFHMVIVGTGHARQELEAMMPGAHFLGYQHGRDLATSYASSDVFVFPSTTETFGLVTLEAMASGVAPVAAAAGGALELIQPDVSGLLAEPFNIDDLTRRVSWLLSHPEYCRTIGENALARARHYGWERILDQLFATYDHVIEDVRNGRARSGHRRRRPAALAIEAA